LPRDKRHNQNQLPYFSRSVPHPCRSLLHPVTCQSVILQKPRYRMNEILHFPRSVPHPCRSLLHPHNNQIQHRQRQNLSPRSTSGRVLTHAIRSGRTPDRTRRRLLAGRRRPSRTVAASDVAHAARGRARHSLGHASSFLRVLPARTTLRLPPARQPGVVQRSRAYRTANATSRQSSTNIRARGPPSPRRKGQRTTAVTRRRRAAIPYRRGRTCGYAPPRRLQASPSRKLGERLRQLAA
jgi:hypothetical protein